MNICDHARTCGTGVGPERAQRARRGACSNTSRYDSLQVVCGNTTGNHSGLIHTPHLTQATGDSVLRHASCWVMHWGVPGQWGDRRHTPTMQSFQMHPTAVHAYTHQHRGAQTHQQSHSTIRRGTSRRLQRRSRLRQHAAPSHASSRYVTAGRYPCMPSPGLHTVLHELLLSVRDL